MSHPLKFGIFSPLITMTNILKTVFLKDFYLCICVYVYMSVTCMLMPTEARKGVRSMQSELLVVVSLQKWVLRPKIKVSPEATSTLKSLSHLSNPNVCIIMFLQMVIEVTWKTDKSL